MSGSTPWYADEQFWRVTKPWLFPKPFWHAAEYEADAILARTGLPPHCRVLDLACGPGRVALEFARRGANVTAVDLQQNYLDDGRDKATSERLEIEWVCADMIAFRHAPVFDLAVCLYNSFGYPLDDDQNRHVLQNVFDALKPGGYFVLDHIGREICRHAIQLEPYVETREELTVEHRAELRDGDSILHCAWDVRDGDAHHAFATDQRVYSKEQLCAMLTDAGFESVEAFGNFAWGPYGATADRLVTVAVKPAR